MQNRPDGSGMANQVLWFLVLSVVVFGSSVIYDSWLAIRTYSRPFHNDERQPFLSLIRHIITKIKIYSIFYEPINNESPSKVQILNLEGKILIEQTLPQGEQSIEITNLKAGFYILKVETTEHKNTSSFKLIKL